MTAHRAGTHQRTLELLFEHPMSHNIEWRDVVGFLDSIGTTTQGGHDSLHATINGKTVALHGTAHKTLSNEHVMKLRHFLRDAGVDVPGATKEPSS